MMRKPTIHKQQSCRTSLIFPLIFFCFEFFFVLNFVLKNISKNNIVKQILRGKKKQVLQINADTQTTVAELQSIIVALRELEQQNQLTIQVLKPKPKA
jgi:hypothetical protein